jgi:uroporphyrinogen decarboxylase
MDSRERVFTALHHKEPDRVPRFNWFSPSVSRRLREILSIPHDSPRDLDILFGHDWIVEFVGVTSPWVTQVIDPTAVKEDGFVFKDAWGIQYKVVREKSGGVYPTIVHNPLAEADDLAGYTFPSVTSHVDFNSIKQVIKKYKNDFPIIGAVPSSVFEGAWFLRGFEKFLQDMIVFPDFAGELMDGVMNFNLAVALKAVELGVDIIWLGDDVGIQDSMLMAPELWRKHLKPRYAKMFQALKNANNSLYIAFHTDGYIEPIIPDFIEIGLDILNSLQPDCNNLESIKKRYGTHLSFWGAIDVQHVLPFGSTKEVVEEVKQRLKQLARGGGFLICASNEIEPSERVVDNIFTYYWALEKYGKYPLCIP